MNYLADLKKLPDHIQDILISPFGAELNHEIGKKHLLTNEQVQAIIDLTNEVYLRILDINALPFNISDRLKINPKKALALAIDVAGQKLLIADDFFNNKISNFLNEKGVNSDDFSALIVKQKEAINKEVIKIETKKNDGAFQDVLVDSLSNENFLKQSKDDTLSLFKEDLVKILSLGPDFNYIIEDLNDDIFEFLEDESFRQQLEGSLYNNHNEIITRIKPLINDRSERGTIANWLKDFISFNGSDNFNDIVLAEYLVNSSNAKKLSVSDKKKIKKLLKIYRNLAFFPESLKDREADWGVIPLEIDYSKKDAENEVSKNKIINETNAKKDILQNNLSKKDTTKSIDYSISKTNDLAFDLRVNDVKEEILNDKKDQAVISPNNNLISELEIMLQDYDKNSLEYKSIQQEIKRLHVKNSLK